MMHRIPLPSRAFVIVCLWTLLWLAVVDVAINLAFKPSTASGGASLARYFEYGRSVEGKLRRMAADPKGAGRILSAGWLDPEILSAMPDRPQPGADLLVGVYGQSFAWNAANEASSIDGRLTLRGVGGPNAPPNFAYAGYKADAPYRKADVVVLGLLSSSLGQMGSMSGLISSFENPAPFTFPRYRATAEGLSEELPLIRTEAAFLEAFRTRSTAWKGFKSQLASSDRGYDRFTFDETPLDQSSIVRLIRRGWVIHRRAYDEGIFDPLTGFRTEAADFKALQLLLLDLALQTRARGERLIVLLMHARGQSNHLHAALATTLEQADIEYVSTHALFSANDATNFLTDGHYAAHANQLFAQALQKAIRRRAQVDPKR